MKRTTLYPVTAGSPITLAEYVRRSEVDSLVKADTTTPEWRAWVRRQSLRLTPATVSPHTAED